MRDSLGSRLKRAGVMTKSNESQIPSDGTLPNIFKSVKVAKRREEDEKQKTLNEARLLDTIVPCRL